MTLALSRAGLRRYLTLVCTQLCVTFLLLFGSQDAYAQLVQVVTETYYQDDGTLVGYPAGHSTYRIYAELADGDDALSAVFAEGANSLTLGSAAGGFWNSTFGGVLGSDLNPEFIAIFPATGFDSMVTIGRDNLLAPGGPVTALSILPTTTYFNAFFGGTGTPGVNFELIDGAWFGLATDINTRGQGPNFRVLLAQITCLGLPEYKLNLQVLDGGEGGPSLEYVWDAANVAVDQIFEPSLAFDPAQFPGCQDPLACNYNISAYVEDGSCFYPDPLLCEICSGETDGTGTTADGDFDDDGLCDVDDPCPTHPDPLDWSTLGGAAASPDAVNNLKLAISPTDGTPWIAYADGANGLALSVQYFDGAAWQYAGSPGFTLGQIFGLGLAVHPVTGEAYVAFPDQPQSDKISVLRFDGTSWQNVGLPGFSAGAVGSPFLAFDPINIEPYVAFLDDANGSKTTVMKFDGTSWVNVGSPGISGGVAFNQNLDFNPIDGTPYVSFVDVSQGERTTVMTFDGSSWVNVGPAGFTPDVADTPSMAIHPSSFEPYVAFHNAITLATSVMRFDGSSWQAVGPAQASDGVAFFQDIAFNPATEEPYVTYRDDANGFGTTVIRFDGSDWTAVGSLPLSAGAANQQSIAFNPATAELYVAYIDETDAFKAVVDIYACSPSGCMDPLACNYDAAATFDDGSCTYPGCNDMAACNFQPEAGCDDGTCVFENDCGACQGNLYAAEYPIGTEIILETIPIDLDLSPYSGSNLTLEFQSIIPECYSGPGDLNFYNLDFNGQCPPSASTVTETGGSGGSWSWSGCNANGFSALDGCPFDIGIPYVITLSVDIQVPSGLSNHLTFDFERYIDINPLFGGNASRFFYITATNCSPLVEGCDDPAACNYNTAVDYNDGSCIDASGCDFCSGETDGTGVVVDGDADDDGSCDDVDCAPNDPAIYPGLPCDDGLICTENDMFDSNCNCTGTQLSCDDGDPCTIDDCTEELGCFHIAPDTDGDGICDGIDPCPELFDSGTPAWLQLGSGLFPNQTSDPDMAFHPLTGEPYVAFTDGGFENRVSVVRFDGTAWEYVGTPGFHGVGFNTHIEFHPQSAEPYVAFRDDENGADATVMRFDGSNWLYVGVPGFSGGAIDDISLDFNPVSYEAHVAVSRSGGNGGCVVLRFDTGGWDQIGPSFYNLSVLDLSVQIHPGTLEPYVSFRYSNFTAQVKWYNGVIWNTINVPDVFGVYAFDFAIDPGTFDQYMTLTEEEPSLLIGLGGGFSQLYKRSGSWWTFLGTYSYDAQQPDINFHPVNQDVYIAYRDGGRTTVKRYNGSSLSTVGAGSFTSSSSSAQDIEFHPFTFQPFTLSQESALPSGFSVYELNCIPADPMGCTDPAACNYDITAVVDNSLCEYPDADGDGLLDCVDPCPDIAEIFLGTSCDDGDPLTNNDIYQTTCECAGEYVGGCTNPAACNFDPLALIDDATCILQGDACDDENPYTAGDLVDATCNCIGDALDTDGDGLTDEDEVLTYGTDPLVADTDGDGLEDGEEVNTSLTDPLQDDTDGDGLTDGLEVGSTFTDPLLADTDGDGCNDYLEIILACPDSAPCEGASCYGDLNEDGQISTADLLELLGVFATVCP